MAAKAAAAHGAHQILQSFETEKVDGFVGNFEARLGLTLLWLAEAAACSVLMRRSDLRRLLWIDETLLASRSINFSSKSFTA